MAGKKRRKLSPDEKRAIALKKRQYWEKFIEDHPEATTEERRAWWRFGEREVLSRAAQKLRQRKAPKVEWSWYRKLILDIINKRRQHQRKDQHGKTKA